MLTETKENTEITKLLAATRPKPIHRRAPLIRGALFIAIGLAAALPQLSLAAIILLVVLYVFNDFIKWREDRRTEQWARMLANEAITRRESLNVVKREHTRALGWLQCIPRDNLSGLFAVSTELDSMAKKAENSGNAEMLYHLTRVRRIVDTQALTLLSFITRATGREAITPTELGAVLADATHPDVLARMLACRNTADLLGPDYLTPEFAEVIRNAAQAKTS